MSFFRVRVIIFQIGKQSICWNVSERFHDMIYLKMGKLNFLWGNWKQFNQWLAKVFFGSIDLSLLLISLSHSELISAIYILIYFVDRKLIQTFPGFKEEKFCKLVKINDVILQVGTRYFKWLSFIYLEVLLFYDIY